MTHDGSDLLMRPEGLNAYHESMKSFFNGLASIPGLQLLFKASTWVLVLPFVLLYNAFRRNKEMAPFCIYLVVLIGLCSISPVYDTRYLLPVLFTVPWMVLMAFFRTSEKAEIQRSGLAQRR
ncbi:MAG: DUF6020 family protein [Eggerthellaceae bacterium]